MKLDRLKELMAKPNMSTTETGEYLALVRELLPGLLRVYVADAREPDCMGREEIQCPPSRDCRDCAKIQAEKKLWELLG